MNGRASSFLPWWRRRATQYRQQREYRASGHCGDTTSVLDCLTLNSFHPTDKPTPILFKSPLRGSLFLAVKPNPNFYKIRFGFNSTHTWQTPIRHQAHCLLPGTARRIMNLQTTGDQEKVRHTIGDHREAFSPLWFELHYSQFSISWKSLD